MKNILLLTMLQKGDQVEKFTRKKKANEATPTIPSVLVEHFFKKIHFFKFGM